MNNYYIYNPIEDGFLKVHYIETKKSYTKNRTTAKKSLRFLSWGELGHGDAYLMPEDILSLEKFIVDDLVRLCVPNLDSSILILVPTKQHTSGHSPDFKNAFSLNEHMEKLQCQLIP